MNIFKTLTLNLVGQLANKLSHEPQWIQCSEFFIKCYTLFHTSEILRETWRIYILGWETYASKQIHF